MVQENRNLDALINKISFDLVNEKLLDENQINKMLGVLANDGVYAWWVYSKKELDWEFTDEIEKLKKYNLIRLLLILERINFLFDMKIVEDRTETICKKQEEIKKLREEIKELKKKIKELKKKIKEFKKEINEFKKEINEFKKEINEKNNEIRKLNSEQNDLLNSFFHQLSENLNSLLFFREILEKILIYARYHAKAMGD